MKKMFMLALMVFAGCKSRGSVSSDKYLLVADKISLMSVIKSDQIRVCLVEINADKSANLSHQQIANILNESFLKWLKALRPFVKSSLVSYITFLGIDEGCTREQSENAHNGLSDVSVVVDYASKTRSHAVPATSYILLNVAATNTIDEWTLLTVHEIGHLFGLDDSYDEQRYSSCKIDQPPSIMCYTRGLTELTQDDINGVRGSFCRSYPEDNPEGCLLNEKEGPVVKATLDQIGMSILKKRFHYTSYRCINSNDSKAIFYSNSNVNLDAASKVLSCLMKIKTETVVGIEPFKVEKSSLAEKNKIKEGTFIKSIQGVDLSDSVWTIKKSLETKSTNGIQIEVCDLKNLVDGEISAVIPIENCHTQLIE